MAWKKLQVLVLAAWATSLAPVGNESLRASSPTIHLAAELLNHCGQSWLPAEEAARLPEVQRC